MASPSDLSLDYKPTNYSSTKGNTDQLEQAQKLREFLARLEEERLKIEAFKRELPLCMQLLNNAVEAYRQQLEVYRSSQGTKPVLEEFIPIKQIDIEGNDKESNNPQSEKLSWMVSAQLWNPSSHEAPKPQIHVKEDDKNSFEMTPPVAHDAKLRNGGGAFLPFSNDRNKMTDSNSRVLPELALAPIEKESEEKKSTDQMDCDGGTSLKKENGDQHGKKVAEGSAPAPQAHRKARRCWSPDLHRRFVNALQILGGAQVATPKQIRELMKVDGLTNDEVKSHLQKYRLHTRRPIQATQPPAAAAPQLVVLGGIWVPPEYATSAATPTIYGAHPGPPPHYCPAAPVGPQEFYASQATAVAVPPLHQQHHLRQGINAVSVAGYKNRTGSPEAEVRSGGDRSESIEEEGEERDEDEEDDVAPVPDTNGTGNSEVALKF
ncbi:Two-component response regulator [Rhynchospora pubera]|uniref:Two-component response regulator n=1 Tax=Rhynchospora pubera TaxID=906938 RepID=A0AAV8CA33_9POAL|nr:Two-component response regulator [Rhynchospora pubera]